jgi:uncharacterized phosphosugar-binding protein
MTTTQGQAAVFGARLRDHLARVEDASAEVLDAVAARMLATVSRGGLVHTAGSGHSTALVLETFYRAGGLACVNPIVHPGLSPLAGALASTRLERVEGLAEVLLAAARPSAADLAFVFSNSGANPVPVELARGLRARGCGVVAVTSLPCLRAAPDRAGAKLDTVADWLIDTQVPVGDAAYGQGAAAPAALSSLASVYVWDLLLARLSDAAAAQGVQLPLWTSSNVPDGDTRNAELARRYRGRIPLL